MEHSEPASANGPLRRKVTLTNSQGLHLRPMQLFVELVGNFQSRIRVSREGMEPVDGKSPWGLLSLLPEKGVELIVEAEGADAKAALEALADFLANIAPRLDPD